MKKIALLLFVGFALAACSNDSNLTISGEIEGLKKGVLYLQKIDDTSLFTIDSLIIDGDSHFEFNTQINSPQVLYLYLKKIDNNQYNDRLRFFAEPGEMQIITSLKHFKTDVKVKGSKNQEKLEEYEAVIQQFNGKRLDIVKADLLAQKEENQQKLDSLTKRFESLLKRKYLYTVNFALNNKNLELAPYLAVFEVPDANIKLLDTIYNALPSEIKNSKYGKSLNELLKEKQKSTAPEKEKE